MRNFGKTVTGGKKMEMILGGVYAIYLIMGYPIPESVAKVIDTLPGKIGLVACVGYMIKYASPTIAVLSVFVVFDLIRRSSSVTGNDALRKFTPSENKKATHLSAFNQFPYTLEEEIVKNMTQFVDNSSTIAKSTFNPVVDDLYNAKYLNN